VHWTLANSARLALELPSKPARAKELEDTQLMDVTDSCPDDWKQGSSDLGHCDVTITGKSDVNLSCALCVTRMWFKQAVKPGGRLVRVPKSGAREGTPVHVFVKAVNVWSEEIAVAPVLRDASGHGRDLKGSFASGAGFALPSTGKSRAEFVWNTDGLGRKGGPARRVQFLTQFGGGEARLKILPEKKDDSD
jgi:hypothetical protein